MMIVGFSGPSASERYAEISESVEGLKASSEAIPVACAAF